MRSTAGDRILPNFDPWRLSARHSAVQYLPETRLHLRNTTPCPQTPARRSSSPGHRHLLNQSAGGPADNHCLGRTRAQLTPRPILAASLPQINRVVAEQRETRRGLAQLPILSTGCLARRARATSAKFGMIARWWRLTAVKTVICRIRSGSVLEDLVLLCCPEGQQLEHRDGSNRLLHFDRFKFPRERKQETGTACQDVQRRALLRNKKGALIRLELLGVWEVRRQP